MTTNNSDPYADLFDNASDPYADLFATDDPYADLFQPPVEPVEPEERSVFDRFLETGLATIESTVLPFRRVIEQGAGIDLPSITDFLSYGEGSKTPTTSSEREPHGFVGKSLDLLQRTQFFSAKFADTLLDQGAAGIGNAFIEGYSELTNPK